MLVAGFLGALTVVIGAFGAHVLEHNFTEKMMKTYHTAVEYQFYHVLALLIVGLLSRSGNSLLLRLSGWSFIVGIILFSGSLYVYVLTGIKQFAFVTPFGGLSFIVAWLFLITSEIKRV